jgi:hypothetical protein
MPSVVKNNNHKKIWLWLVLALAVFVIIFYLLILPKLTKVDLNNNSFDNQSANSLLDEFDRIRQHPIFQTLKIQHQEVDVNKEGRSNPFMPKAPVVENLEKTP